MALSICNHPFVQHLCDKQLIDKDKISPPQKKLTTLLESIGKSIIEQLSKKYITTHVINPQSESLSKVSMKIVITPFLRKSLNSYDCSTEKSISFVVKGKIEDQTSLTRLEDSIALIHTVVENIFEISPKKINDQLKLLQIQGSGVFLHHISLEYALTIKKISTEVCNPLEDVVMTGKNTLFHIKLHMN